MRTERIGFSNWQMEDLDLAHLLWQDKAVPRYICASGKFTDLQIKDRLQAEMETQTTYGVQYWPLFNLADGELIGCCGLHPHAKNQYEIGFHLLTVYWHQGYAYEAAKAVIHYAFHTLHAKSLFAGHHPDNLASFQLLKRLKFQYTGDEFFAPTGLDHPSYCLQNINDK